MGVIMMVQYEGRMMSTEEVLIIKNNTKTVIETPEETPKVEIKQEIIETPEVEAEEVIADELEEAKIKYKELFGRKPQPNTKLKTLLEKIATASEA